MASFLHNVSDKDRFVKRRICVVRDCTCRVADCEDGKAAGPAVVVLAAQIDRQVGLICQHHTAELLEQR